MSRDRAATGRLLVCGFGAGMDRSLRDVREVCAEIVVVAPRATDEIRREAPEVVVADPQDADAVLAALRSAGTGPISGVLSLGCDNAPAVSRLGRALGCPGLDEAVALDCTLKDRRIAKLAAAGLATPDFGVAADLRGALSHLERIGFPAIVKPVDRTSSIGVLQLDARATAAARIAEALARSRSSRVIVEAFLVGSEHTVAGVVAGGEILFTGFSDREYGRKHKFAPYVFEEGDTLPTALPEGRVGDVLRAVARGVRALGIDDAVFNTDVLVTDEGEIVLIEVACRLTGARIATEVVPLATGVNVLPNAVRLALGCEVVREELRPTRARAAAQRYLPATGGTVRRVGDVRRVAVEEGVYDLFWGLDVAPGRRLPVYRSGDDVLAGAIATGSTATEAAAAASRALAHLPLELSR